MKKPGTPKAAAAKVPMAVVDFGLEAYAMTLDAATQLTKILARAQAVHEDYKSSVMRSEYVRRQATKPMLRVIDADQLRDPTTEEEAGQ
jgi:hypothetical protein